VIILPIRKQTLNEEIERFLDQWHSFFIDWWWRDRYKIPFGSKKHREQSFIDMAIEYKEVQKMKQIKEQIREQEDEDMKFGEDDPRIVKMTRKEVEDEYDNLDLNQFNNG
jgi:curved DNA-binding protein CbpA